MRYRIIAYFLIGLLLVVVFLNADSDSPVPAYILSEYYVSLDGGNTYRKMDEKERQAFDNFNGIVNEVGEFSYYEYTENGQVKKERVKEKMHDDVSMVLVINNKVHFQYNVAYYIAEENGKYFLYKYHNTHGGSVYVNVFENDFSNEINELRKTIS